MIDKLKIIASDTAVYGLTTITSRFLTFLLTPFYTNYLSPSELGFVTYIHLAYVILLTIISFGLENAFFRFFPHYNKRKVFRNSFFLMLINSLIISLIIYFLNADIALLLNGGEVVSEMIKYESIVLFFDSLLMIPFAFLRIERKARLFGIYNVIKVFISIAFNYLFIAVFRWGGESVFMAQSIASVLTFLLVLPTLIKGLSLKGNDSSLNDDFDLLKGGLLKSMLRFGVPTIPASLAVLLLRSGDHFLIKEILGPVELAMYSTSYKLGIPMMMFVTAFDQAWRPYYMNHFKDENSKEFFSKIFVVFITLSSFLFLAISLFIEYVVQIPFLGGKFINPIYWEGLEIIPYIIGAYLLLGVFNFLAMGVNITGNTKYLPLSVGIAALFNIIFNSLYLHEYGYMISAYLTTISYLISVIVLFYFSNKYYKLNINWLKVISLLLSTITIYLIVTSFDFNKVFVEIIIKCLALIVFISSVFVFKIIRINDLLKVIARK